MTSSCSACGPAGHGHLDRGPHHRQRGAQLVRRIGDDPALDGERGVQPFQHLVEGVREFLQLVLGPGQRQPLPQVPFGGTAAAAVIELTGRSTRPAITQPRPPDTTVIAPRATRE